MSDLNSGTKQCQNCGQNINLASFLMHEAFCLKNIIKCKLCNNPYDKNLKDAHFDEFHSKIKCECGEVVEKGLLEVHKAETCRKRQVQCFYCDLSLDFDKFQNHLESCGTRTEICDKCKEYVLLKDMTKHLDTNCAYPVNKKSTVIPKPMTSKKIDISSRPKSGFVIFPCEFCDEQFVGFEELIRHQTECALNSDSFATETRHREPLFEVVNETLLNKFTNFGVESDSDDENNNYLNPKEYDNKVPCEFCSKPIEFDLYEDHLKSCGKFRYTNSVPSTSKEATNIRAPRTVPSATNNNLKKNTPPSTSLLNKRPSITRINQSSPIRPTGTNSTRTNTTTTTQRTNVPNVPPKGPPAPKRSVSKGSTNPNRNVK